MISYALSPCSSHTVFFLPPFEWSTSYATVLLTSMLSISIHCLAEYIGSFRSACCISGPDFALPACWCAFIGSWHPRTHMLRQSSLLLHLPWCRSPYLRRLECSQPCHRRSNQALYSNRYSSRGPQLHHRPWEEIPSARASAHYVCTSQNRIIGLGARFGDTRARLCYSRRLSTS